MLTIMLHIDYLNVSWVKNVDFLFRPSNFEFLVMQNLLNFSQLTQNFNNFMKLPLNIVRFTYLLPED